VSDHYSPERRTALVLTGTGADGAYHAGVLRALQETGIKIDVVAARGVGAVAAAFASIDGASRLADADGVWRRADVARLYGWRWPVRLVLVLTGVVAGVLASPVVLLAVGLAAYVLAMVLGMAGLDAGSAVFARYVALLTSAFEPAALPTWLPRLVTLAVITTLITLTIGTLLAVRGTHLRRHARRRTAWSLVGAPIDLTRSTRYFVGALWDLLNGGAALKAPQPSDLSHRFAELLNDNLGQPGFSELLLTVHDLDARRDLVFGLVREPFRRALFPSDAPAAQGAAGSARRAEAFDLAGAARNHLVDVLRASLTVAGTTEAAMIRFGVDTYWRGEVHRIVDRPSSVGRLLEEAAAAGVEQVILVSASPEPPGPHELSRPRVDPRGAIGERLASEHAAVVRDAVQQVKHRFRALYQIRPVYNPLGPFDLGGAFDERSDRHHALEELIDRGYEDAYRQFIEPVVGSSGEQIHT
jgi:hypothetical protein